MKFKVFTAIIALFCLSLSVEIKAFSQTSSGVSASQVGPVTKVMFKNGYFEKNADGDWDEYFLNGQVRFPFRETGTSRDSVFLRNDSLMVDLELNMAKGEIWAEWPGQIRHKMHKITNVQNNAPEPPAINPSNPPVPTQNGVRLNFIEYSGGKLENMGNSEWADYRDNSDAVHLYKELSNGSDILYLYSDSSKRLYRAEFSTQGLYMATDGGPIKFQSAIKAMNGVSANPPSIPSPPQPELPGTMSQAERTACLTDGGKLNGPGYWAQNAARNLMVTRENPAQIAHNVTVNVARHSTKKWVMSVWVFAKQTTIHSAVMRKSGTELSSLPSALTNQRYRFPNFIIL